MITNAFLELLHPLSGGGVGAQLFGEPGQKVVQRPAQPMVRVRTDLAGEPQRLGVGAGRDRLVDESR